MQLNSFQEKSILWGYKGGGQEQLGEGGDMQLHTLSANCAVTNHFAA